MFGGKKKRELRKKDEKKGNREKKDSFIKSKNSAWQCRGERKGRF